MNLGIAEIILILVGCFFLIAVPAGIVLLVVLLTRRQSPSSLSEREAALLAENARLREDMARLKRQTGPA